MWKRLAVPIVVLAWFAVPSVAGAAQDYTPMNLTATVDSGGLVRLAWDDTQDPNFAWFGVRRSTDPNADEATWTRLPPNFTTSQATDAGLPPGTYYYYVTERSTDGTISGRSNVASVTITAPSGTPDYTPTHLTATVDGSGTFG